MYHNPPRDPHENMLYEAAQHERDELRERDARFREPSDSEIEAELKRRQSKVR